MSKAVIAAGHVTDEAEQFLRLHGAAIGGTLGLTIIEVPEDAEICGPGYQFVQNEYAIQWPLEDGNDPEEWIEVELYLDAYETCVSLRHASHAGEPAPAPTSEQQPFTYIQDGTEHQAQSRAGARTGIGRSTIGLRLPRTHGDGGGCAAKTCSSVTSPRQIGHNWRGAFLRAFNFFSNFLPPAHVLATTQLSPARRAAYVSFAPCDVPCCARRSLTESDMPR